MNTDQKFSEREFNELIHFDQLSNQYDANYGYERPFTIYKLEKKSIEFVKLVNQYFPKKNSLLVELGCGTGEYTKRIAEKLPSVTIIGIDISPNIVGIAKEKCKNLSNITFKTASAYSTGIADNSIDIVCGFYALHHFDFALVHKEIFRILKKGGLAIFYEPNILNPMVYIIKSSPGIKKRIGDSPDEWAINPLTIAKSFPGFEVLEKYTTEFLWPPRFIPDAILTKLDKLTHFLRYVPGINLLGGSLMLCIRKI